MEIRIRIRIGTKTMQINTGLPVSMKPVKNPLEKESYAEKTCDIYQCHPFNSIA